MKRIAVFDTKKYDQEAFKKYADRYEFAYFKDRLTKNTVALTNGFDAVVCFVNDELNEDVLNKLNENNIHGVFLRCAGYNNVDLRSAYRNKIHIARVPAYSPYAIAEHAFALLLSLNRHIHKAYIRSRDFNFNLEGLSGFDLHEKTIGVVGTGKIGRVFIDIAKGFGMKVLCYDPYPIKDSGYEYVSLDNLRERETAIKDPELFLSLHKSLHFVECKSGVSYSKKDVSAFATLKKNTKYRVGTSCIICSTDTIYSIDEEVYALFMLGSLESSSKKPQLL